MTTSLPQPVSDTDLLRRYAASGSPEAFAALVERYLPLIYSAALRQTRDRHLAEDVAQATLIVLSQKAGGVDPALLPGWLVKTTHYASRNALRQRARRVAHEQRAAAMKSESETPADPDALSRVIDPALARLGDADRTAVVLRYFQNKSFAEVAAQLQTTESAAQRRIARAVEKLRGILGRQGVTIAPAALPAALAAQALHPVPPDLALHVMSLAGSKTASTSLIAKGALHAMAATKVKVAVGVTAAVLLVGAAVPTAYHYATARPGAEPAPAVAAVPLVPPGTDLSRPVTGALPPGMTVEPLAIMNLSDKRWILPTGGEMADLPAGARGLLNSRLKVQGATHALIIRINAPDKAVSWRYSFPQSGTYGSTSTYDSSTQTYYVLVVFAPKPGATGATLAVSAATGPWTTSVVIPASATAPIAASVNGVPITFDPPTQDDRQVHVRRKMDRSAQRSIHELCNEFYGVNDAGKKVPYIGMSSDLQGDRYDFNGTLSAIKEFRLDTRPYNYHATYAAVPLPQAKP